MSDREHNKKTVIAFYETAFGGDPESAVAQHLGDRYIQHNPQAADGPEAFAGFVNYLRGQYPDLHLDIRHVLAENDLVFTHSHLTLAAGEPGQALADIFRLQDGKIVEHWDVVQDVPDTAANTMECSRFCGHQVSSPDPECS